MLALELGRTREELLDSMSAQELMKWMAFLAVREERMAEARRNAADGFDDDEVHHYGGDD